MIINTCSNVAEGVVRSKILSRELQEVAFAPIYGSHVDNVEEMGVVHHVGDATETGVRQGVPLGATNPLGIHEHLDASNLPQMNGGSAGQGMIQLRLHSPPLNSSLAIASPNALSDSSHYHHRH